MIRDLLDDAAARLRVAGIDTPAHDAKLLLAEALGCELRDVDKALLMGFDVETLMESLSAARASSDRANTRNQGQGADDALQRFDDMVARRVKREPLQYIVGHAPFRYLDMQVGPGVFIPRPETETVVEAGLEWITRHGIYSPRVVDLCAGSGAIGLAILTEVPGSEVWAVELSKRTAEWTRRNLAQTTRRYPSVASNYHLEIADATSRATLASLDGTIDLVITNPPYVPQSSVPEQPEVRDWDPDLALYGGSSDGTLIPERIIDRAFGLLKPGGLLVMEHDVTQGDRLVAYASAAGFAGAHTGKDWAGRDRFLVAEKLG